jgi:hypothetical protein
VQVPEEMEASMGPDGIEWQVEGAVSPSHQIMIIEDTESDVGVEILSPVISGEG